MIRQIVRYPDPVLRRACTPVEEITDDVKALGQDLLDTMSDARGLGLAAPQIGASVRVIAVAEALVQVLINPSYKPVEQPGECLNEEGCLSLPRLWINVRRSNCIAVSATDLDGKPVHFEAAGRTAYVIQHEIDHLDGKLTIDYLSAKGRREMTRLLNSHR